ncbi:MAG TPA: HAMP domain-containing sensor histidine kinase, partial [Candidatus Latescibacteria bacterium]|nr:HAMP domain-containing sensor histidine kinase [Candidatus Latescibacterota bacterium]
WARSEASERALWDSQQLAMIGQMTATMAHEVRNPLGIIKAAAERIRRKYGDGTELFDFIPDEVDRLDRLTEWYLRFARPGDLRLAKARLGPIVRDSISRVRGELEAAAIEVVVEDLAQSECLVDYDRLVQVNINILLNARQAIGSNGRVEAKVIEKSGVVRVEVKDNGPGIPARIQPNVFQPFFTTKTAGSGLGLPVMKQVVEALGGRVGLNSRPGEGSTVWYELPCAKNT